MMRFIIIKFIYKIYFEEIQNYAKLYNNKVICLFFGYKIENHTLIIP